MEPKFVTRDEFKVVGMECISKNENDEFGQLWGDFFKRIGEVKHDNWRGVCYGLCECGPECKPEEGICKCEELGYNYMACVELSDTDQIPAGMIAKTIPVSKYAVFTHKGSLKTLNDTFNHIYHIWLPSSGAELAGSFGFELYDERFNPASDDSEIDIYVPVK